MAYPFAGVDPFIEYDNWPGFHLLLCGELIRQLNRRLPPGFVCRGEVNFGLSVGQEGALGVRPDAAIHASPDSRSVAEKSSTIYSPATSSAVLTELQDKHRFLQVLEQATGRVVAIIEILSPSNKVGDGLIRYLRKRQHYIQTGLSLLEIDIVRQGHRHYEELLDYPDTPYAVFTYDAYDTTCRIWSVGLSDKLPVVPLRLAAGAEVAVDVQVAVEEAWQAGGYAQTFAAYEVRQIGDGLDEVERRWLQEMLE